MKISSKDKVELLSNLLTFVFKIQKHLVPNYEINKPKFDACIYALWHGHQCGLYGLKDKEKTNVLISKSIDGQIIANAIKTLGMKDIRGSKGKKGAVEATMQMISKLREKENVAITVDGPSGPIGVVKNGVIKVAKLSGCPIVPFVWYSKDVSLISFPSWDKFLYPLGYTRLINLYGEPIFVDKNGTDEDDEKIRLRLENALKELEEKAPVEWNKVWKGKLWKK